MKFLGLEDSSLMKSLVGMQFSDSHTRSIFLASHSPFILPLEREGILSLIITLQNLFIPIFKFDRKLRNSIFIFSTLI